MKRNCEVKLVDVLSSIKVKPQDCEAMTTRKRNQVQEKGNIIRKNETPSLSYNTTNILIFSRNKSSKCDSSNLKVTRSRSRNIECLQPLSKNILTCDAELNVKEAKMKDNLSSTSKNIKDSQLAAKTSVHKRKIPLVTEEHSNYGVKNKKPLASNFPKRSITSISEKCKLKNNKIRRNSCKPWESKLTGAQRVSKRLTNLKNKNKELKNLEGSVNYFAKKIKPSKPSHRKITKEKSKKNIPKMHIGYRKRSVSKSDKNKTVNELQTSYRKLTRSRKLFPKVLPSKKTKTNFRIAQSKSNLVLQQNSIKNTPKNIFLEHKVLTNESDDNQINKNTPTFGEVDKEENSVSTPKDYAMEEPKPTNNDQMTKSRHTEENHTEEVMIDNIMEECTEISEVIIIDVQSEDNVLCNHTKECNVSVSSTPAEDCNKESKEMNLIGEDVSHCVVINTSHEIAVCTTQDNLEKSEPSLMEKTQTNNESGIVTQTNAKPADPEVPPQVSSSSEIKKSTTNEVVHNIDTVVETATK